jgi:transposase
MEFRQKGNTLGKTSEVFDIATATIKRWQKLQRETGSLNRRERVFSPYIFKSEDLNNYIEAKPNALLKDIAGHFGGSTTGAFYALEREKITLKKRACRKERDEEERALFDECLKVLSEDYDVGFIDECGAASELNPIYGRSKRGVELYRETSGKRSKKTNVIAGYINGVIIGLCTYAWNTDTDWFCMWFEHSFIRHLKRDTVIVMDNAGFHNKVYLEIIAEAYGHMILWLPAYSPDKNPIEHVWANMKKWLRCNSKNYTSTKEAVRAYFI